MYPDSDTSPDIQSERTYHKHNPYSYYEEDNIVEKEPPFPPDKWHSSLEKNEIYTSNVDGSPGFIQKSGCKCIGVIRQTIKQPNQ